jgi:hypothetical protein
MQLEHDGEQANVKTSGKASPMSAGQLPFLFSNVACNKHTKNPSSFLYGERAFNLRHVKKQNLRAFRNSKDSSSNRNEDKELI